MLVSKNIFYELTNTNTHAHTNTVVFFHVGYFSFFLFLAVVSLGKTSADRPTCPQMEISPNTELPLASLLLAARVAAAVDAAAPVNSPC